jgi:hypothetical protein
MTYRVFIQHRASLVQVKTFTSDVKEGVGKMAGEVISEAEVMFAVVEG